MAKKVKTAFILILISALFSLLGTIMSIIGSASEYTYIFNYISSATEISAIFIIIAYAMLLKFNKRFKGCLIVEIIDLILAILGYVVAYTPIIPNKYYATVYLGLYIVRLLLQVVVLYQLINATKEMFLAKKESLLYKLVTIIGGATIVCYAITMFLNLLYIINALATEPKNIGILKNVTLIFDALSPIFIAIYCAIVIHASKLLDNDTEKRIKLN